MSVIGAPLTRVDGRMKVTGSAKYSAEFQMAQLAYAVLVQSTIPAGQINHMDTTEAERAAGVISILKSGNAPRLAKPEDRISLLQDNLIHYNNQSIAVVVAESLHQAHYAVSLIRTQYNQGTPKLNFIAGFPSSYPGSHTGIPGDLSFGDIDAGLQQAEIKIDQIYTTPIHHHNPMEPHATIAQWDGDKLTLHDASQHISGVQETLGQVARSLQNQITVTLTVR